MKRLLATLSLVAVATSAATAATATKPAAKPAPKPAKVAAHKVRIAPADEYFGKLKMSILGMANTIKDQGLRVESHPDQSAAVFGSINLVEDAMHDWQRKYPEDGWIPKTLFALEQLYLKIPTDEGHRRAQAALAWMRHDFSRSNYATLAQKAFTDAQNMPTPAAASATGAVAPPAAGAVPASAVNAVPVNPPAAPANNAPPPSNAIPNLAPVPTATPK